MNFELENVTKVRKTLTICPDSTHPLTGLSVSRMMDDGILHFDSHVCVWQSEVVIEVGRLLQLAGMSRGGSTPHPATLVVWLGCPRAGPRHRRGGSTPHPATLVVWLGGAPSGSGSACRA